MHNVSALSEVRHGQGGLCKASKMEEGQQEEGRKIDLNLLVSMLRKGPSMFEFTAKYIRRVRQLCKHLNCVNQPNRPSDQLN